MTVTARHAHALEESVHLLFPFHVGLGKGEAEGKAGTFILTHKAFVVTFTFPTEHSALGLLQVLTRRAKGHRK